MPFGASHGVSRHGLARQVLAKRGAASQRKVFLKTKLARRALRCCAVQLIPHAGAYPRIRHGQDFKKFDFRKPIKRYPWDAWLNGEIWSLEPKKDFQCKVSSFRLLASAVASRRGLKVRSGIQDGHVVIRAFKNNGAQP